MLVDRLEPVVGTLGGPYNAHPLAVVTAARRLHDGSAPVCSQEVTELTRVVDGRPGGHRRPQGAQHGTHVQLVLGDSERAGARADGDPGRDERGEYGLRHVLVIEGDHVDVRGERENRGRIPVVPDHRRGDRRRAVGDLGEHAQLDAELDRRGNHHACQLATADDADSHAFSGSLRKRRLD
jgi:hypothetical protein